jgi:hypothetical protein
MIAKHGETRLRKETDSKWTVLIEDTPFPAERGKIDRFFEILDKGRIIRTATEKEELWRTFEVGEDGMPQISFIGEGGTARVIVGKPGDSGTEQYVRLQGEKRVFLLSEGLSFYADQKAPYWSDLRLFPRGLEGRNIVSVSLKGTARRKDGPEPIGYRLVREKGEGGALLWSVEGRSHLKVKQPQAEGLANSLAVLTGSRFVPPSMKGRTGLGRQEFVIEFTSSDGRSFSLEIGNPADDKDWYCSGTADGTPPTQFVLSGSAYERVVKSLSDIAE